MKNIQTIEKTIDLLGLSVRKEIKKLKTEKKEDYQTIASGIIKEGVQSSSLELIRKKLDLDHKEVSALLDVSIRTLQRKKHQIRKLSRSVSDRLFTIANVVALAEMVLENEKDAIDWLKAPHHALKGDRPIDLLVTSIGIHQVQELLMAMEHTSYY